MTTKLTDAQAVDLAARLNDLVELVESGEMTASRSMLAMLRAAGVTIVATYGLSRSQ